MMTDAELSALESAAKGATKGAWLLEELSTRRNGYAIFPAPNGHTLAFVDGADAAYIAAANPAAVLELIAELRKARVERDWLAARAHNGDSCPRGRKGSCCASTPCRVCWLDAAKEATC